MSVAAARVITIVLAAALGGAVLQVKEKPPSTRAVDEWIGKEFPLARAIDCNRDFMKGYWTIVLFHNDCDKCREAIPRLEARARRGDRVALIELAPYASPEDSIVLHPTACAVGRLSSEIDLVVSTPTAFRLKNGIVQSQSEDPR